MHSNAAIQIHKPPMPAKKTIKPRQSVHFKGLAVDVSFEANLLREQDRFPRYSASLPGTPLHGVLGSPLPPTVGKSLGLMPKTGTGLETENPVTPERPGRKAPEDTSIATSRTQKLTLSSILGIAPGVTGKAASSRKRAKGGLSGENGIIAATECYVAVGASLFRILGLTDRQAVVAPLRTSKGFAQTMTADEFGRWVRGKLVYAVVNQTVYRITTFRG